MRTRPALALVLIAGLAPAGLAAQQAPTAFVLRGAQVLHHDGDRFVAGLAVRIEDGRIVQVAPSTDVPTDGASVLDLSGTFLIPGLIDLHSHLLLHPYDETSWNDQVLRESLELRTIRGTVAARETVLSGFTTLRELGTEGAAFADIAIRDAIDAGMVVGPRVHAATRALVATGCYGPSGFDPRWVLPKGAQVADGADAMRRATREQIAAGADWIKVYADYRRRPGAPSTPTFTEEEIAAAVDEATSAGLPVAAHAVTNAAIRRCVAAGVRTIEHGYEADAETLALMAEHGVALCPTLAASYKIAQYRGWRAGEPEPSRVRNAREMFVRALASGVTVACGSDVGVFSHGDNALELELMVAYGMTPAQALTAATRTAAEVLGEQRRLGRIAAGFAADLVALDADPLQDIGAVRAVRRVWARGKLVRR